MLATFLHSDGYVPDQWSFQNHSNSASDIPQPLASSINSLKLDDVKAWAIFATCVAPVRVVKPGLTSAETLED